MGFGSNIISRSSQRSGPSSGSSSVRVDIQITGMEETIAALAKLPGRVQTRALKQAVHAGSEPVITAARAELHPGHGQRFGYLQAAIGVKDIVLGGGRGLLDIIGVRHGIASASAAGEEPANYSHLIELGHKIVPRGPGKKSLGSRDSLIDSVERKIRRKLGLVASVGQVKPIPFLKPAFESQGQAALELICSRLASAVEEEAAKLATAENR